jgi:hypothetical protein
VSIDREIIAEIGEIGDNGTGNWAGMLIRGLFPTSAADVPAPSDRENRENF